MGCNCKNKENKVEEKREIKPLPKKEGPVTTCIFTMIKNEHEYLDDFLSYHIGIGIDHIFLFEDEGSDSHDEIASKYGDKVTLKSVTDVHEKNPNDPFPWMKYYQYYKACVQWIHDNYDYDWCFSIDCDEFITPTDDFPECLRRYEDYDAIYLYWKNYGWSGHLHKPPHDKPIWEIFTEECGYTLFDKQNTTITQVCFNMRRFDKSFINGPHFTTGYWVKTDMTRELKDITFDVMYLRHYITKSFEEYIWKLNTRGMRWNGHRGINDFFEMHPHLAYEKDAMLDKIGYDGHELPRN